MSSTNEFRQALIKLGSENPELRTHIRPLLAAFPQREAGPIFNPLKNDFDAMEDAANRAVSELDAIVGKLAHAHSLILRNPDDAPIWAVSMLRRGDSPFNLDHDLEIAVRAVHAIRASVKVAADSVRMDGSWKNKKG